MLPDVAFACEQCFGAGNAETAQALTLSMLALLCTVGLVWGGIGMFVINVRKRTKQLEPGDLVVNEYGDLLPMPHDDSDARNGG